MNKKIDKISGLLRYMAVFCLLMSFNYASAAVISAPTLPKAVGLNQELEIPVYLDSESAAINAVNARISFPQGDFEIKDIRDGNSILLLWVDKPKAENDSVTFSGLIPNGLTVSKGYLLSVLVKPKKISDATVNVSGSAYLNDGKGTEIKIKEANYKIKITKENQENIIVTNYSADKEPPESFLPVVTRSAVGQTNGNILIFSTQDKYSGIEEYRVSEDKPNFFIFEPSPANWIKTDSPYALKDQGLGSFVFVKAIDRNGNERIEKISPENSLYRYRNYVAWGIILSVLLAAVLLRRVLLR